MRHVKDYRNEFIRISRERVAHIMEHPEMTSMEPAVDETLEKPEWVIRSKSDENALLYYRFYQATTVGGKFLCAIVKGSEGDRFLLTAYLTDKIKTGEVIWNEK